MRLLSDGDCDDGGTGSEYAFCAFGTDCADCGVREVCNQIQVTGAASVQSQSMGIFSKMNVQTTDGRFVYQNSDGKYIFFSGMFWLIGSDYNAQIANVAAFGTRNDVCASLALDWRPWTGSEWSTSYDIIVACTMPSPSPPPPIPSTVLTEAQACCPSILVYGAEAIQPVSMGTFSRSASQTPGGRFVYESAATLLLFLDQENWQGWEIVDNITGTATAYSNDVPMCPNEAMSWQIWDGSSWTGSPSVSVQCNSPSPLPPAPLPPSPSPLSPSTAGDEDGGGDSGNNTTVIAAALGGGGVVVISVLVAVCLCKHKKKVAPMPSSASP